MVLPPCIIINEISLTVHLKENNLYYFLMLFFSPFSRYHPGVIAAIYSGSQCATCGMRFKEIQSEQYSRHLDWHFRRNRREKDGAKKPFSRRWFYEIKVTLLIIMLCKWIIFITTQLIYLRSNLDNFVLSQGIKN